MTYSISVWHNISTLDIAYIFSQVTHSSELV